MSNNWEILIYKPSWQHHVNNVSIKPNRTKTLLFKKGKCRKYQDPFIKYAIFESCLSYVFFCFGSKFRHYLMDCKFPYHSPIQAMICFRISSL